VRWKLKEVARSGVSFRWPEWCRLKVDETRPDLRDTYKGKRERENPIADDLQRQGRPENRGTAVGHPGGRAAGAIDRGF